ncbi:hypothetical protein CR51_25960 [Caballeronia megalochromosomata]|nr:hypothetical protein CR51_25960 [Caballeronia megalochromosomata]
MRFVLFIATHDVQDVLHRLTVEFAFSQCGHELSVALAPTACRAPIQICKSTSIQTRCRKPSSGAARRVLPVPEAFADKRGECSTVLTDSEASSLTFRPEGVLWIASEASDFFLPAAAADASSGHSCASWYGPSSGHRARWKSAP